MRLHCSLFALLITTSACDPSSESAGQVPTETSDSGEESVGESGSGSCDAVLDADDFDRSCSEHADCVTVFEGSSKDACRECAFAAINVDEEEEYLSILGPLSCSEAECGAGCLASPGSPGACIDNLCELGQTFACGEETCNALAHICVFFGSDVVGEPGTFACRDLPTECIDSTDCACLADSDPNLEFCVTQGGCEHDGLAFRLTCPGG